MAAAMVTVRNHHARKREDTGGEKILIEHTMPTDETLVLKRGYLSRQTMSSAGVIYTKGISVKASVTHDVCHSSTLLCLNTRLLAVTCFFPFLLSIFDSQRNMKLSRHASAAAVQ